MASGLSKVFTPKDKLTSEALNAALRPIYAELESVKQKRADYEAQITLFNSEGIKRVAEAIKPLVDQLSSAIDGGLLVAQTDDLVAIVEGENVDFLIPETARVAFRPTPFLAIMAPDVRDDWAIGRVLVYNDDTGLLTVEILYLHGSGAERLGWTISASSGVVEAVSQWLDEVTALRDDVAADKAAVATDKATVAADKATVLVYKNAAAQSVIDAAAQVDLAADEVTEASNQASIATTQAGIATTKAAEAAASAASIAGGPVASVNGRNGVVTGLAEASDVASALATRDTAIAAKADATATTAALATKADSTAVTAAVAAAQLAATELQKDFVASGAIAAGQFVALRSDGKVEVVTGTETLATLGADNTQLSVTTEFRIYGASFNATSGKLAIIYLDQVVPRTLYVVVGTVSSGTISFGTPVTVDSNSNPLSYGDVCWNAAGTSIIVAWPSASSVVSLRVGTISGTTISLGATATGATYTSAAGIRIFHDDTHGSRVIMYLPETTPANGRVAAATYSGTTFTIGSPVIIGPSTTLAQTDCYYDGPNARFIAVGTNGSSTTVARCGTVSGTTFSVGAEASKSGARWAVAFEASSGKVVVFTTPSTSVAQLQATVVTFSGTTSTFNTSVSVSASAMRMPTGTKALAIYNSNSGKVAVVYSPQVGSTSAEAGGYVIQLGTVSGTTISFTAQTMWLAEGVNPNGTTFMKLYSHPSTGEIAMTYADATDYNRLHVATGAISGTTFTPKEDVLVRSAVPTYNALAGNGAQQLQAGWSLIDLGNWNPDSGASTTLTAFNFIFPSESTNADDWIGVAKTTVANGATVTVALRGGLDKQRSGLTAKTRYFLKGDGTLIANDNGRPAGIALSATELLTEAA